MRIAVLVIGVLGVLLGLIVTVVSLILPSISSGVSPGEAMLGVIPGVIVFFFSLIIAIVGLILVIKGRK